MKIVNVTSKKTMNVPARFTMIELGEANPGVGYPTLNARVDRMVKNGELVEVSTVKRQTGRGRVAIVYALPEASLNPKDKTDPLYIAKKQGRDLTAEKVDGVLVPVVKVASTDSTVAPVEAVASEDTVDVPVEVVAEVAPEPSATETVVETVPASDESVAVA